MEKKICSICQTEKEINEFHSNGKQPSGKRKFKPYCKECEIQKKYEKFYSYLIEYFGGANQIKCCKCGYNDYWGALDFHHTNPQQKRYELSNMLSISKKIIFDELDKGILVCSNCHRKIHAGFVVKQIQQQNIEIHGGVV